MSALKDKMAQFAATGSQNSGLRQQMEQFATGKDENSETVGEDLYKNFQSRIEAAPKYHVAPVVDSWDKTGIAESELWKTEDEYKKDASALTSEIQSAFGKYAKGEMTDADINTFADKYQRFAAKEKAYFSDRYQKTGTLATADSLKLRRDAKKDAHDATTKRLNEIANQLGSNDVIKNAGSMGDLYAEKEQLEKSDDIAGYNDLQDKYYRALQFEAEKDVADKYDGYKAEYGKNGVDYSNKSGSFDKVNGVTTEKVSYKGASDFLAKYTDAYKTNIDSNIRELSEYGTDEQKDIFLQLFTEKGYKDALNYAKDIHPLISKQAAKIQGEKYEDSNALERFGMGVGAVFEGGIGDIGQSIVGVGKALTVDTSYTHRNTAQQKADAVIEAEQNPVADLLMQGGRSAVANSPSIIVGVATGGSSLASTFVLFASAAGSAYVDAVNKGNGYYASLGYGITNGVLEAATEKLFDVPGFYGGSKVDDAFKGIISKGVSKLSMGTKGKTALNFLGYMAANGFGEAVEEGIMAAVEPTLGNIFLGEKNESFTAEHFGEIGYAALLGTVSSFLMPLSYVSTYADAKSDTAVWSVLNGEKVTDMQIEDIFNSRSSREIFEKAMGFKLSENKDVAKAQITAVANSIRATSETIKGTDVSSVVENIDVSSVAEYTEAVSDYITEPDAEYVANETEAVAEMTEIANEELAREAANKEETTPTEAIENAASEAVEETVSDLMDGVSAETASINEGIEVDEELVDYGVNDRQAALERAVDGDGEIARLTESYENGEMSEAEYNEAVTRRVSEIERSISEGDGDVSEVDSVPVADGVTENGGTKFMSKDEFDTVRNNSYSVTRNSAKDIKANPIFAKVSASDIRAFRAVGKALGVDVKAFDGETLGLTGTDGAYDPKTRTIYLNVTSPLKAISSAFRHEVIHYLKASSPKAYGEFAAFVIDKYKEQYSEADYNAWLEAKRKEYEAMGETLTRDGAEEEFLAQFGMDMLQQKSTARDFVRNHRSVAMKVWDAIRNLINKIRRFYGMQELPTSVYDAISQLAENTSGQVQVYGDSYTRSHLQGSNELLPDELNIDALNAADEALLNAFAEVADINERVQAKLKNAPADVLNDDVKRAQYIEELWTEETGVESDGDADVKFAAKPSSKNPKVLDPRTVTEDDVRELLENVKNGEYYDNTYIPIRISTPLILIELAKRRNNDVIDNNPIVISAGKAYQAMARKGADIDGTPHELSVDDMISIIKSMADPEYIVYQKNGRYVEVVAYNTEDGKNAFAVLEMGDYKDDPYMNGYEDGLYNVLVTTFSPNAGKLNELLSSNKVIYDKKKDASRGTSSSTVLSVSNDTPFYEDSISENEPSVNTSDEKKSLAKVANGDGVIYKGGKAVAYNEGDGSVIPLEERFNNEKSDIRWSKSSPDSSDTAYIPKGEKPKSSTASIAALAKRNAILNKRLADAKNQLKLTKAYSPEPGEIDALAERIASDYNNGDNVKGIKTALTGIYRLWNEGKVTGDEYKLKQANREIASLAQDIVFGEDANVPSTEANNKAISQFADMLSNEIAFVAEAEPTFADKAKSQLEYEREMAEIDKKEAVAKERLKAEQKAFEKAEKTKDKAERQKYVEFWNKELDKIDKQKAKSIEKAKAEVDRLHQIASRKSALQDMRSTWSATKEQINEIADGLISFYNKDAKKSRVASLVEKIYKARSFAQKDSNVRDVHLKNMNNYIDELTSVLSARSGDSASIKSEIDNILYEIGRDSLTSFDKASMRGEAIAAEINALRNARNSENAGETDARINELRKEYAEVKASVASDGIKSIIENTVKWSGKSVESLVNTVRRLERRLQKDIAKQKIDDIRRRGTESKERQQLLKLMQRLKRVKTKPELMAAISEIIGDYDTVAVNITGRKVAELGTIQDEFLAEQKRLIVEGEAPKIMTQALKDKLARLDNKKIGDMSIEEVRSLTEALLEIETRVKAEKKLLNDEFKQTTKEAGRQIIKELNHEKAKGVDANLAKKKNNGKYDHLRARTFFLNLCGYNENSTLYKFFDAILEGRRNTLLYKQTQDNRLSPWTKDKEYMKTIIGKDAEGIDIGGGVKVNKASLIALYLHSMNDDNMKHIEHGGIEIPDFNLMKKGEIKEAYEKMERVFLTKSEIYALCQKHLNEKDKNLANAIRVYFNEVSKKALNEVSLKIYGYEKFNVENYYPIRVDKNFLNSDGTDIFDGEGNINILESGFAQERQKGAITPMLLVDALTVFDRSVNDHALYANLAIPLRDMKAAFGVRVVSKTDGGDYRVEASVWDTLTNNYGSDAETYIKDFWQNLQGKTVKELGSNILSGAIGRLATSALYLNEQSALKQFTAYPVALAVLDSKSLGKALKDIGKIDEVKLERYNRYTPWLVHRSEGLSDATIADLRQGKKNHKWANWLQYTDVLTSKKLLKACEYYVKDNYKDIKPDTDAFYKKVAEKFNDVIEQTQQNNDVVSKTRRLNNQSGITRMLTVFKSQSYQQLNMYIEAQGRVEAKELAYKNNKDSAVAKEAFEDAKLKSTRTVAGIQLSVAMNIAISLAMLLLKGRWDELDKDKDGEVEMLEVLGNVVSRYFDEQSSMFLFGDVVSYAKDAITGGTPFTPSENPVIEPAINVIDKSMKLVGEVEQWIRDGKFNGYELFSAVKGLSVETLKSIGVPAGNAYNLLTTSAYGSSFLLTGGSNDFAQIIRHTIKGDLISKSGNAENYTINKDVKLALFRLFNAKDREVEFERATGILKFAGATDADIYKAIAYGYSITLSDNDVNKIEYLKSHLDDKRGLTYYFDVKKLAKSIDVNDNINQEEAEKAIDMLAKKHPDISNDVKAILWQMFNKSWSYGNNPYSKKIGNEFRKNMGWDK